MLQQEQQGVRLWLYVCWKTNNKNVEKLAKIRLSLSCILHNLLHLEIPCQRKCCPGKCLSPLTGRCRGSCWWPWPAWRHAGHAAGCWCSWSLASRLLNPPSPAGHKQDDFPEYNCFSCCLIKRKNPYEALGNKEIHKHSQWLIKENE